MAKDRDTFDYVTAFMLPTVALLFGLWTWFLEQDQKNLESQIGYVDDVGDSSNAIRQGIALDALLDQAKNHNIDPRIVTMLEELQQSPGTNGQELSNIASILVSDGVSNQPSRPQDLAGQLIYIQIPRQGADKLNLSYSFAQQLVAVLQGRGAVVPGIQDVQNVPNHTQVRWFDSTSQDAATTVTHILSDCGYEPQSNLPMTEGYPNDKNLEIWISASANPASSENPLAIKCPAPSSK